MSDVNQALCIEPNQRANTKPSCFDGRARRKEYWWKLVKRLLLIIGIAVLIVVVNVCMGMRSYVGIAIADGIAVIIGIGCTITMIPVIVRRFHDIGMSGWWWFWFWLFGFIPGYIIIGCIDGDPWPNKYGPDPKNRNDNPFMPSAEERLAQLEALGNAPSKTK